ncbi:hypothetical protein C8J57DRAFT_1527294 [Mycena rebaudengoi]|nr:hypothetical protein C8J57DRAFT_1527294 [Mycena rebaudengoi]
MLCAPGRVTLVRCVCIPHGKTARALFSRLEMWASSSLSRQTAMHRHGRPSHAVHLHPQRRLQSFDVFSTASWFFPRVSARPAGRWGVRDTSSPAVLETRDTGIRSALCGFSSRLAGRVFVLSPAGTGGMCDALRAPFPRADSWDPLAHTPCLLYFVATRASALARELLVVLSRRVRRVDGGALVEFSPAYRAFAPGGEAHTSPLRRGLSESHVRASGLVAAHAPGGSLIPNLATETKY